MMKKIDEIIEEIWNVKNSIYGQQTSYEDIETLQAVLNSLADGVVVADQKIKPNDFYSMEWNEGYELINRTEYYIVKDGKWSKFNNVNQLGQIFKDKKKEIRTFASENKIQFDQTEDVEKLVRFTVSN